MVIIAWMELQYGSCREEMSMNLLAVTHNEIPQVKRYAIKNHAIHNLTSKTCSYRVNRAVDGS
jgi:hypothetical protein